MSEKVSFMKLSVLCSFGLSAPAVLFRWIISNQPTVLFSPKRPTTTDKLGVLFSQHQPNEHEHFLSAPAERT
jgi:hypothetical protein